MRGYGIRGTGLEYFKQTSDYLIAVYIEPGRWGGSCSVGFAIHPKQIDRNSSGKIELEKLKVYQYEFKMCTTKEARSEWWNFSDEEEANLVTLEKILGSIKKVALPVIEQVSDNPGILDSFNVSEMGCFHECWTKKTGVSIATTDIRLLGLCL